jgi:hypothetical protein
LNKIKKDSAFVEKLFAAKALREGGITEMVNLNSEKEKKVNPEVEVYRRPDQLEDIISAAEEAAYSEGK